MSPLTLKRKKRAKRIRTIRSWHRVIGLSLLVFFFAMALTGVLLALKDPIRLKPETQAVQLSAGEWVSLDQINTTATTYAIENDLDTLVDRIDVRMDKGIAKVLFKRHFTELQVSGKTAEILSARQRTDHLIERNHDGSIVEFYAGQSDSVKMIYSSLVGIGLIELSLSGFFLWYAPKKNQSKKS